MRFYILMILLIGNGCSNQNEDTLIKINTIKSDAIDKKITQSLEELDYLIEYFENPPDYVKSRQKLYSGLVYLDSISENPREFNFDSLVKRTKTYSNYLEEQADIVNQLKNSGTSKLINSSLNLEFKKLKQIMIQDALLKFNVGSFKLEEPIVLIKTNQDIYKKGDRITGSVRLVMGSKDMKSSINYIKINQDSIEIDDQGKGIIDMPVNDSNDELNAEINMKYPVNGRYTFKDKKLILIK